MEFIKLNENWNAEPGAPGEEIEVNNPNVKLSFYLNTYIYDGFNEKDRGILEFQNCFQFSYGGPNDEGFYSHGQSRYKKYGIKWGEFYLVEDSDWETISYAKIYVNRKLDSNKLNHYLFYLKDGTFECFAENYKFYVIKNGGTK
ncbi:MAG: hypothetical protein FWF46_09440 [Oscillospiraceae bacterium]|nr:hypothetical protein [Oscillospiraceae bacterium]